MEELKTYSICGKCGGDGTLEEDQGNVCYRCDGTGYTEIGKVDGAEYMKWMVKKIKKILQKLEIPEDED